MKTKTYKDPLHFTVDQLTAAHGKSAVVLNKALLDKQNAWASLEKILWAHELKLIIIEMIEETSNIFEIRDLGKDLTEIEFHLQKLWGFKQEKRYHRFWYYPKCMCPKMDNDDRYPYESYIVKKGCPLHF
jgi:hypothetical protein